MWYAPGYLRGLCISLILSQNLHRCLEKKTNFNQQLYPKLPRKTITDKYFLYTLHPYIRTTGIQPFSLLYFQFIGMHRSPKFFRLLMGGRDKGNHAKPGSFTLASVTFSIETLRLNKSETRSEVTITWTSRKDILEKDEKGMLCMGFSRNYNWGSYWIDSKLNYNSIRFSRFFRVFHYYYVHQWNCFYFCCCFISRIIYTYLRGWNDK